MPCAQQKRCPARNRLYHAHPSVALTAQTAQQGWRTKVLYFCYPALQGGTVRLLAEQKTHTHPWEARIAPPPWVLRGAHNRGNTALHSVALIRFFLHVSYACKHKHDVALPDKFALVKVPERRLDCNRKELREALLLPPSALTAHTPATPRHSPVALGSQAHLAQALPFLLPQHSTGCYCSQDGT